MKRKIGFLTLLLSLGGLLTFGVYANTNIVNDNKDKEAFLDNKKEEILSPLPKKLKRKVIHKFSTFQKIESKSQKSAQKKRKRILEAIEKIIYTNVIVTGDPSEEDIFYEDYLNFIKPNLCEIGYLYDITPDFCNKDDDISHNQEIKKSESDKLDSYKTIELFLIIIIANIITIFIKKESSDSVS